MVTFSRAQILNKTNPRLLYQAGRNSKICQRQISQSNCANNGTCCGFGSCCLNDTKRLNKQYCHICEDESLCCPLEFCCYKPQKLSASNSSNSGQKFLQIGIVVVALVGFTFYIVLAIKFGSKKPESELGNENDEDDNFTNDSVTRSNESSLFTFLVRRNQQQRQPATYIADNVLVNELSMDDSIAGLLPPPPYTP